MNKVFLLGRLTADPELRQTQNGVSVASFTIAANKPYKKGEEQQAEFIPCVAWRGTADFVSRYFNKGKPILVEGRLQARGYEDKQGIKRKITEVVCDNVNFVDGAGKSAENERADVTHANYTPPVNNTGDFQEVEGYNDLPF